MEEWVANILTQVPLAVSILIVWNIMDWRQAGLDKQRETARAADNKAQNKNIDTLLQTSVSFAKSVGTLASKVDRLVDYTAGVQTAVDIGFGQTSVGLNGLSQHLTQQDSRIPKITQTVINANEAAMIAHEERMIAALESMERRLVQCVDDKLREPLYNELLSELKQMKAIIAAQSESAEITKQDATQPPDPPKRDRL